MTSPLHRQLDNGNGHRLSSHWFTPPARRAALS